MCCLFLPFAVNHMYRACKRCRAFQAMAFTWGLAICLILSGRYMNRRKHLTFSIVIAAICCLQIPFGTILGVFTLIVLSRPSVKAMYMAATP